MGTDVGNQGVARSYDITYPYLQGKAFGNPVYTFIRAHHLSTPVFCNGNNGLLLHRAFHAGYRQQGLVDIVQSGATTHRGFPQRTQYPGRRGVRGQLSTQGVADSCVSQAPVYIAAKGPHCDFLAPAGNRGYQVRKSGVGKRVHGKHHQTHTGVYGNVQPGYPAYLRHTWCIQDGGKPNNTLGQRICATEAIRRCPHAVGKQLPATMHIR